MCAAHTIEVNRFFVIKIVEVLPMEKVYEIVSIKQVVRECEFGITTIKSPEDAAQAIIKEIGDEDREIFFVICLNTKNNVVAIHRSSVGSLNSAIVHPREVFKAAILNNAASIIISHNHPAQSTLNIVS